MNVHQIWRMPNLRVQQLTRVVFAGAVCVVSGCASNGYEKGDVAAASMQKAAAEVQAEQRALDGTVSALGELVNAQGGDLGIPFTRYSDSLERLVAAAHRTETTGRKMEVKNADYVDAWDRQLQSIDYQHIRDLSEARRAEVTNRMETVTRRYRESQAAVQPLISYFEDIRKALSTDLTPAGLESLKEVVTNANNNVAKVQTALDALSTELTDSSAKMSSVAYHTAEGKTPPHP
jgi:uncharacterized coiled-coil protein SlyX